MTLRSGPLCSGPRSNRSPRSLSRTAQTLADTQPLPSPHTPDHSPRPPPPAASPPTLSHFTSRRMRLTKVCAGGEQGAGPLPRGGVPALGRVPRDPRLPGPTHRASAALATQPHDALSGAVLTHSLGETISLCACFPAALLPGADVACGLSRMWPTSPSASPT